MKRSRPMSPRSASMRSSPSRRGRPGLRAVQRPQSHQTAAPDPSDLAWLDLPIRALRGKGRGLNPRLKWFFDQLPARARTAILKAARGELRAFIGVPGACLPSTRTLREFIVLPTRILLRQPNYGYGTHSDMCRAIRAYGVMDQLFSGDENHLPRL